MTNEQIIILAIALIIAGSMCGPSAAGIERELKRIADALEKLERRL